MATTDDWRERGACFGDEQAAALLMPGPGEPIEEPGARGIALYCAGCEVSVECLEYAVTTFQPNGVWGGMTTRSRINLRKEQLRELAMAAARPV